MSDHATRRIGCLTSSVAKIIMHPSEKSWASLRDALWASTEEHFNMLTGGARQWGHEHEEEGAAKFWEAHPEITSIEQAGYFEQVGADLVIGSSPDRMVRFPDCVAGLEIKSPTSEETFNQHAIRHHYDQCQHGLLVTGLPKWYLFVHCGKLMHENMILPDPAWQAKYLPLARKFWTFLYEDRKPKMRKLSIGDIK